MRVAVFISGNGSNLQALIDAITTHTLDITIVGVISNQTQAYGIERATAANITTAVFAKKKQATFEQLAAAQLDAWQVEVVILAGFMRILSEQFIDLNYQCQRLILNIHPSLLPKYKGLDTHARALTAGDDWHGCSVHVVTPELDSGQVLAQLQIPLTSTDTAECLISKIQRLEHRLYPWVVDMLACGHLYTISTSDPYPVFAHRFLSLPLVLTATAD